MNEGSVSLDKPTIRIYLTITQAMYQTMLEDMRERGFGEDQSQDYIRWAIADFIQCHALKNELKNIIKQEIQAQFQAFHEKQRGGE